jgi:hypothetical protein
VDELNVFMGSSLVRKNRFTLTMHENLIVLLSTREGLMRAALPITFLVHRLLLKRRENQSAIYSTTKKWFSKVLIRPTKY